MATLGQALLEKYPTRNYLRKLVLGKWPKDIELSEMTPLKADALRNYICSRVSTNSALTYFKQIRCVMGLYGIKNDVKRQLKTRFEDTYSIFLTEEEIDRIRNFAENRQGKGHKDSIIISRMYAYAFIISANCGMRVSDVMNISKENIVNGVLTYTSQKTGITAQVPARKELLGWVTTLKDMMTKYNFDDAEYRRKIKEVCMECRINDNVLIHRAGKDKKGEKWKFVGTHTARRSFATNLYLRGLDIYTIGRFLGHRAKDIEMTARYICCSLKPMDENVMAFFK